LVFFITDKHKKKNKIQKLVLLQLEQEKVMHEKSAELKDVQLQLESEVKHAKERELTALQLRIFEMKVVFKCSTEEKINQMLEIQWDIENGNTKRDFIEDGYDDVIASFKEVPNEQ
jgi:hypothetical protein